MEIKEVIESGKEFKEAAIEPTKNNLPPANDKTETIESEATEAPPVSAETTENQSEQPDLRKEYATFCEEILNELVSAIAVKSTEPIIE